MSISRSPSNVLTFASTDYVTRRYVKDPLKQHKYCVVVPVFNSQALVGETLRRAAAVFESHSLNYSIVAVNDGSTDNSWQILLEEARANPHIVAIDLVRNYGQHAAILCGLQHSDADFTITIDDDLQNPPEQIILLIKKALEGFDFVCGQYGRKRHAIYRRWGSLMIAALNERIFGKPRDFALTNFRLFNRQLKERICNYRSPFPYINGLAVSMAGRPANVEVEHHERSLGKSGYSISRILKLVLTILFNYSSFPLRFVGLIGLLVSTVSFLLGLWFIFHMLCGHAKVPGWTTIVVLLSFYNGLFALMFAMVGEYLIRVLNTASDQRSYHLKEIVNYG